MVLLACLCLVLTAKTGHAVSGLTISIMSPHRYDLLTGGRFVVRLTMRAPGGARNLDLSKLQVDLFSGATDIPAVHVPPMAFHRTDNADGSVTAEADLPIVADTGTTPGPLEIPLGSYSLTARMYTREDVAHHLPPQEVSASVGPFGLAVPPDLVASVNDHLTALGIDPATYQALRASSTLHEGLRNGVGGASFEVPAFATIQSAVARLEDGAGPPIDPHFQTYYIDPLTLQPVTLARVLRAATGHSTWPDSTDIAIRAAAVRRALAAFAWIAEPAPSCCINPRGGLTKLGSARKSLKRNDPTNEPPDPQRAHDFGDSVFAATQAAALLSSASVSQIGVSGYAGEYNIENGAELADAAQFRIDRNLLTFGLPPRPLDGVRLLLGVQPHGQPQAPALSVLPMQGVPFVSGVALGVASYRTRVGWDPPGAVPLTELSHQPVGRGGRCYRVIGGVDLARLRSGQRDTSWLAVQLRGDERPPDWTRHDFAASDTVTQRCDVSSGECRRSVERLWNTAVTLTCPIADQAPQLGSIALLYYPHFGGALGTTCPADPPADVTSTHVYDPDGGIVTFKIKVVNSALTDKRCAIYRIELPRGRENKQDTIWSQAHVRKREGPPGWTGLGANEGRLTIYNPNAADRKGGAEHNLVFGGGQDGDRYVFTVEFSNTYPLSVPETLELRSMRLNTPPNPFVSSGACTGTVALPDRITATSGLTATLKPGSFTTVGIQVRPREPDDAIWTFAIEGAPPGVTVAFSPTHLLAGSNDTTTAYLRADKSTKLGDYTLKLRSMCNGMTKDVTAIPLHVRALVTIEIDFVTAAGITVDGARDAVSDAVLDRALGQDNNLLFSQAGIEFKRKTVSALDATAPQTPREGGPDVATTQMHQIVAAAAASVATQADHGRVTVVVITNFASPDAAQRRNDVASINGIAIGSTILIADPWHIERNTFGGERFWHTLAHELGHVLGLSHTVLPGDEGYPYQEVTNQKNHLYSAPNLMDPQGVAGNIDLSPAQIALLKKNAHQFAKQT